MGDAPSLSPALAVIPARWASTRFPGKALALIHGKPMIQRVWERAQQARDVATAVIATDDARIRDAAEAFGAQVVMTSPDHPSGTDRVWEAAQAWPAQEWILNIQGDEPQIDPAHLQTALESRAQWPQADIITLGCALPQMDADPNVVKIARAADGRALYFSRAPIPHRRDAEEGEDGAPAAYRHLGVYLFRREALARMTQWPPSPLERLEKLEQLRALENGLTVYVALVDRPSIGVDTPADLAALLATEASSA